MEEDPAIDLLGVGDHREELGLHEIPLARGVSIAEDHLAAGVGDLAAVLEHPAHLDRDDLLRTAPLRLADADRHRRRLVVAEDDALEQLEMIDPPDRQPGMAVQGPFGQPLEDQGQGQDGMAVDHVRPDHRQRVEVHLALEHLHQLALRGGRCRGLWSRLERRRVRRCRVGEDDDLDRPRTGPFELIDDQPRTCLERDQPEPLALEERLEGAGHHAAVPGAPVEGDDPASRQSPSLALGQLVERLVRRRVGHLADASKPCGGGREQDQESEQLGIDRLEEGVQPLDLRVEDLGELGVGLVLDPPVGEDAGAVDQSPDRSGLASDLGHQFHDGDRSRTSIA